jgi:hypothetical protein
MTVISIDVMEKKSLGCLTVGTCSFPAESHEDVHKSESMHQGFILFIQAL